MQMVDGYTDRMIIYTEIILYNLIMVDDYCIITFLISDGGWSYNWYGKAKNILTCSNLLIVDCWMVEADG